MVLRWELTALARRRSGRLAAALCACLGLLFGPAFSEILILIDRGGGGFSSLICRVMPVCLASLASIIAAPQVLESRPPQRLVLSWEPPSQGADIPGASRVSFEISAQNEWPFGPWVGLRIEHSGLEPNSEMLHSITFGWPAVLSGLKTIIESPGVFASN